MFFAQQRDWDSVPCRPAKTVSVVTLLISLVFCCLSGAVYMMFSFDTDRSRESTAVTVPVVYEYALYTFGFVFSLLLAAAFLRTNNYRYVTVGFLLTIVLLEIVIYLIGLGDESLGDSVPGHAWFMAISVWDELIKIIVCTLPLVIASNRTVNDVYFFGILAGASMGYAESAMVSDMAEFPHLGVVAGLMASVMHVCVTIIGVSVITYMKSRRHRRLPDTFLMYPLVLLIPVFVRTIYEFLMSYDLFRILFSWVYLLVLVWVAYRLIIPFRATKACV